MIASASSPLSASTPFQPVADFFAKPRVQNTITKTVMVAGAVLAFSTLQAGATVYFASQLAAGCASLTAISEMARENTTNWLALRPLSRRGVELRVQDTLRANFILGMLFNACNYKPGQLVQKKMCFAASNFSRNPQAFLKIFSVATIVAPIAEEIIFRGFLMERLEDGLSLLNYPLKKLNIGISPSTQRKIVNRTQATVFALLHFSLRQSLLCNLLVLYHTYHTASKIGHFKQYNASLLPGITAHGINNMGVSLRNILFGC